MTPDQQITTFITHLISALLPYIGIFFAISILGVIFRRVIKPKLRKLVAKVYGVIKPKIKGWVGEVALHTFLRNKLPYSKYHLARNVMLPTSDGTTQIDHIVVSRYGIFVIETKTYKGWIFGSEREPQWTQTVFRKKSRFQNPLRQNYQHTKTLSDLTGIPHDCIKSVIAFSGECTFKTDMPENVLKFKNVPGFILGHQEQIIKDEQVAEIAEVIGQWAGTVDKRQRTNHVRNLKKNHGAPKATDSVPPCPRCGNPMVSRTNQRDGDVFWGCPQYPKCRGTRQMTNGDPIPPIPGVMGN